MSIEIVQAPPVIRRRAAKQANWLPWAIGGAVLLAGIGVAAILLPEVRDSVLSGTVGSAEERAVLAYLKSNSGDPSSVEIMELDGPHPLWVEEHYDGTTEVRRVIRVKFRHATGLGGKTVSTFYLEPEGDSFSGVSEGRHEWISRFGFEELKVAFVKEYGAGSP